MAESDEEIQSYGSETSLFEHERYGDMQKSRREESTSTTDIADSFYSYYKRKTRPLWNKRRLIDLRIVLFMLGVYSITILLSPYRSEDKVEKPVINIDEFQWNLDKQEYQDKQIKKNDIRFKVPRRSAFPSFIREMNIIAPKSQDKKPAGFVKNGGKAQDNKPAGLVNNGGKAKGKIGAKTLFYDRSNLISEPTDIPLKIQSEILKSLTKIKDNHRILYKSHKTNLLPRAWKQPNPFNTQPESSVDFEKNLKEYLFHENNARFKSPEKSEAREINEKRSKVSKKKSWFNSDTTSQPQLKSTEISSEDESDRVQVQNLLRTLVSANTTKDAASNSVLSEMIKNMTSEAALNPKLKRMLLYTADVVFQVCDKLQIDCFLYGGSLLGSFRHHGIIRWDDDIDIMTDLDNRKPLFAALSTLKPYYDVINAGARLKFFSRKALQNQSSYSWGYPYVDINFYYENETHIQDSGTEFLGYIYPKSVIFPLHKRPMESIMVNAPFDTYAYLRLTYGDICMCKTYGYSHRSESAITGTLKVVSCSALKDILPFVSRKPVEYPMIEEALYQGGQLIQTFKVKEPHYIAERKCKGF